MRDRDIRAWLRLNSIIKKRYFFRTVIPHGTNLMRSRKKFVSRIKVRIKSGRSESKQRGGKKPKRLTAQQIDELVLLVEEDN